VLQIGREGKENGNIPGDWGYPVAIPNGKPQEGAREITKRASKKGVLRQGRAVKRAGLRDG